MLDLFGLGHIPEYQPNDFIEALRILCAVASGLLIAPMLIVAMRTANVGFYALSGSLFLNAVGEADQLGRPFIPYQLPLRFLVLGLSTWWLWKRRNDSKA